MRTALLTLVLMSAAASPALAQSTRITLHDPMFSGPELGVRAVRLAGQGAQLELDRGARVEGELEFAIECGNNCGPRDQQQVLIGFAGAPRAEVCVWQGTGSTQGWLASRFSVDLPDVTGIYELRVRKTRAPSCAAALELWGRHPGDDGSVGVVVVDTAGRPQRGDRRKRREIAELQRAFDASLMRQEEVQRQLLDLSSRPTNGRRARDINALVRESITLTTDLRLIQSELREALEDRDPQRPPPRLVRPIVTVVADLDPRPIGMHPEEFRRLLAQIDKATFPQHQLQALKDYLVAGVLLDIDQAKRVLAKFVHDTHKVEVGALLCRHIVEPRALPELLTVFTFESYRQELRDATGGRCGGAR